MYEYNLSDIIKNKRKEKNYSMRKLASIIKCNVKTISDIESGITTKPLITTLEKLSEALEIEITDILAYAGYDDEVIRDFYKPWFKNVYPYKIKFKMEIPASVMCFARSQEEAENYIKEVFQNIDYRFKPDTHLYNFEIIKNIEVNCNNNL